METLKADGELYERVRIRSCKYLNNIVEQDHRRIKRRIGVMFGFKRFENARIVLAGIELAQKIHKRQLDLRRLGTSASSPPEMCARVLAA